MYTDKEMVIIRDRFYKQISELAKTHSDTVVTKKNVYRTAKKKSRIIIDSMLDELMLPDSEIIGFDNLTALYNKATEGKSCLILMEHYSNFDFPGLMHLLRMHSDVGIQIESKIVPMAAMKLNEEHPVVSSFTDAYRHISIFPARRIDQLVVTDHDDGEFKKAREINHAALKRMRELKNNGDMILMFPSGTRYKPDNPQTKRVVKAADSFMRRFDYVIFGGIAGNTLLVNNPDDMLSDYIHQDVLIYAFSPIYKCKSFRKEISVEGEDNHDLGMRVVERIEQTLEKMHAIAVEQYKQHSDDNE